MKPREYDKYGKYGSPIPGSILFRAYCFYCNGPMRVKESDLDMTSEPHRRYCCTDCDRPPIGSGNPSTRHFKDDIDANGWYSNARGQGE